MEGEKVQASDEGEVVGMCGRVEQEFESAAIAGYCEPDIAVTCHGGRGTAEVVQERTQAWVGDLPEIDESFYLADTSQDDGELLPARRSWSV